MKERLSDSFLQNRLSLAPEAMLDVSKPGLRIEIHERIGPGSEVRIRLPREVVIHGEIRYCRRAGTGFHAGILIAQVFQSAEEAEQHLFDGEMSLYLLGKGLSAAELLRLRKHLNDWESCRLRVAEGEPVLKPGNRRRT